MRPVVFVWAAVFLVAWAPLANASDASPIAASRTRTCENCDRLRAFQHARDVKDWASADGLMAAVAADGNRDEVGEYLVYDRGRCAEALDLLRDVREHFPREYTSPATGVVQSALVCEAARIEGADPARSRALLAEAVEDAMKPGAETFYPDLYLDFASQAVLNETAMRFLTDHLLDNERSGYAIEWQIENGRVDNVRRLLALGANPNEYHGRQHAALGQVLELLPQQPDAALAITRVLLDAGADPASLVDFEAEDRPPGTPWTPSEPRKQLDAMLRDANERLAKTMPVRIDFYDAEPAFGRGGHDGYARFYLFNRSGRDVVLDTWHDDAGFDQAGDGVRWEYRVAPAQKWIPIEADGDPKPARKGLRRSRFASGDRMMLYVPFAPHWMLVAPPGFQLRIRIPSMDGVDFLSLPFALHDGRSLRGAWPRTGPDTAAYFASGKAFSVPGGIPTQDEGRVTAPHSHFPGTSTSPPASGAEGKVEPQAAGR